MSPDASYSSTIIVSPNSSTNSTQSLVLPVSAKVLSTATLAEAINDNVKLQPSMRDSVKLLYNLTYSMKPSMSKVVPRDLFLSLPCPNNNRSRNPVCLITRQIKYAI